MSEKTLGEIIELVRDGNLDVSPEDLRFSVLVLSALLTLDFTNLIRLKKYPNRLGIESALEEHFNRTKRAYAEPPKKYMGWNNDPDNPEYQERRKIAFNIMNKVEEQSKNDSV